MIPRSISIAIALFILTCTSCTKTEAPNECPQSLSECALDLIAMAEDPASQSAPQAIWKQETETTTYYYVAMGCCDMFNPLYDIECEYVCAPDGGFTGTGDGTCPDLDEVIESTLIWEAG